MDGREVGRRIELLAGVGLVAFGALFALAELAGEGSWRLAWPLFVIVPGLLLLAATFSFGRDGGFLAIPGSLITVAGLLLLVTNTLDAWRAWAYVWPLLTPGAVGLGLLVFGAWSDIPPLRRVGIWLGIAGLVLFVAFAALFELVLGISGPLGPAAGRVLWPLLLVALGVWLIVLWGRKR